MIINALVIRDGDGERRLGVDQLPIRIGSGSDCDIRLPGPAGGIAATLDALDGQPFLQPAGGSSLTVNGEALTSSRRLADADELGFYGSVIRLAESDGLLSLEIVLEDSAYVTRPPEMPGETDVAEEEAIAPAAFRRAAEVAPTQTKAPVFKWQQAVAGAIVLLGLLSWLLFSSKSIQFEVLPAGADRVQVRGGWFRLPLADRALIPSRSSEPATMTWRRRSRLAMSPAAP